MPCNDPKCPDRSRGGICTNMGCSLSAFRERHILTELVSKVSITPECSADTIHKLNNYSLKPELYKIGSKWQKAKR